MYTINLDKLFQGMPVWADKPQHCPFNHPRGLGRCLKSLMGRGKPISFATRYAQNHGDMIREWLKSMGVEGAEVVTEPNGKVIWDEMEVIMDDNGELIVKKVTEDGIETTKYRPVSIETTPIEQEKELTLNDTMAFSDVNTSIYLLDKAKNLQNDINALLSDIADGQNATLVGNKIQVDGKDIDISPEKYDKFAELHLVKPALVDNLAKEFANAVKEKQVFGKEASITQALISALVDDADRLKALQYANTAESNKQRMKNDVAKAVNAIPAMRKISEQMDAAGDYQHRVALYDKAMRFLNLYRAAKDIKADRVPAEERQVLADILKRLHEQANGEIKEVPLSDADESMLVKWAAAAKIGVGQQMYDEAKAIWDAKPDNEKLDAVLSGDPKKLPDVLRRAGYVDINGIITRGLEKAMALDELSDLRIAARSYSEPQKRMIIANGPNFVDWFKKLPKGVIPAAEVPNLFMRYVRGERDGVLKEAKRLYGIRGEKENKPAVNLQAVFDRVKAGNGTAKDNKLVEYVNTVRDQLQGAAEVVNQIEESKREAIWQGAYQKAKNYTDLIKQERELVAKIAKAEHALQTGGGMPPAPRKPTVSDFTKGNVVEKRRKALENYNRQMASHREAVQNRRNSINRILSRERERLQEVRNQITDIKANVSDAERNVWQYRRAKQKLADVVKGVEPFKEGDEQATKRLQEKVARNEGYETKANEDRLRQLINVQPWLSNGATLSQAMDRIALSKKNGTDLWKPLIEEVKSDAKIALVRDAINTLPGDNPVRNNAESLLAGLELTIPAGAEDVAQDIPEEPYGAEPPSVDEKTTVLVTKIRDLVVRLQNAKTKEEQASTAKELMMAQKQLTDLQKGT